MPTASGSACTIIISRAPSSKEQDQLTSSILAIQRELDGYTADAALVEQHLTQALDLLEDCQRLYLAAPDRLKKLLNQVFFERILINPAVDDAGRPIIPPPALQTSLKARRRTGAVSTGSGKQTSTAQKGDASAVAESRASTIGSGAGGQSANSATENNHSEASAATEHSSITTRQSAPAEPGSDKGSHPESTAPATISIIDPYSRTSVIGELASPFDQLSSQQLKRAAQQAAMGAAPTTRTPVHDVDGRRRCNSGNDSAPTPVTQAKGSYTELVVDPAGLEPTTDAV